MFSVDMRFVVFMMNIFTTHQKRSWDEFIKYSITQDTNFRNLMLRTKSSSNLDKTSSAENLINFVHSEFVVELLKSK